MGSFKCVSWLYQMRDGTNLWTRYDDLMDKGHWKSWNAAQYTVHHKGLQFPAVFTVPCFPLALTRCQFPFIETSFLMQLQFFLNQYCRDCSNGFQSVVPGTAASARMGTCQKYKFFGLGIYVLTSSLGDFEPSSRQSLPFLILQTLFHPQLSLLLNLGC